MIKHRSFLFEELTVGNHWVNFANFGDLVGMSEEFLESSATDKVLLDPSKVWQVGFDQSTSNTGIFIKDYNNTEVHMIEVSREKGQIAGDYIFNLEMFLHRTFEAVSVSHMIYEKPILTKEYRSSRTLFQLEGMLCTLPKRYKEFSTACLDNIENQSWRSSVVPKELDRLYERKQASRMAVEKIYPWCSHYGYSLGPDNDVYEAIGILMGWFICSFDALGRPYVRGSRTTKTIGGFIFPGVTGEEMSRTLDEAGVKHRLLVENPSYSIYKNLAAGVKPYEVTCVEMTNPYAMLCLCVECNVKWENPSCTSVLLADAATCDSTLTAMSGGVFHFVL